MLRHDEDALEKKKSRDGKVVRESQGSLLETQG